MAWYVVTPIVVRLTVPLLGAAGSLQSVLSKKSQIKQKCCLHLIKKVLNLPLGVSNSKLYQFHAVHTIFIPIMLYVALKRVIEE